MKTELVQKGRETQQKITVDLGAADEDSEDCEKNFDASNRPSGELVLNYDQEEDVQESDRARNEARVGVAKLAATVSN